MSVQANPGSPDDPSEILRLLPVQWHEQFLADYHGALDATQGVLRLWRLRAVAYSNPGFGEARQAAREGWAEEFVPAEQVSPGW
jgi:hypothetical protein